MSFLKSVFTKFRNQSYLVQISMLLIVGYYAYAATTNPVFDFVIEGIAAGIELIYDLIIMFIRYFSGIFITFSVLTILIKQKVHRNIIWFAIGIAVSVLGSYGYFGELSWNPLNFTDSYDYIAFEIQVMCFYYVVILTMLPTYMWLKFSMGFIGMLGAAAYGFSFVPFVGDYFESLINMVAKFSLFVFFVLNVASYLLITIERNIYSLLNRDMSDIVSINLEGVNNNQNYISEAINAESLIPPNHKKPLEIEHGRSI